MEEQKKFVWSDFDPACICRFVLHHFGLVVLAALTGAMLVSLLLTFAIKPSYTSSATFAVTSRSTVGSSPSVAATNAVATQFGELLKSDLVQGEAARQLMLEAFPAAVSVTVPENTNILVMTVTAASPEAAYRSALAIMEAHKPYSSAVFSAALLDTVNGPSIPAAPDSDAARPLFSASDRCSRSASA